jgi:tRNA A58 N-methylase Trm61
MTWVWIIPFALLLSLAYAAMSGAPWVPTWRKDIERIQGLLKLRAGETCYELGCGDARVTVALARMTRAKVVGIELSAIQYVVARIRVVLSRVATASVKFGNVFSKNLSDADAVYLFLMPETYAKLAPKFERELRPGTRVASYVWPIPGWEPIEVSEASDRLKIYLYER